MPIYKREAAWAGRTQLAVEVSKWERLSAGVNLVLHRA
jgi:hypothetical protein